MNKRGFPLKIEQKQAALRRYQMTDSLRQKIEAEIARDYAGYNGEKLLDYHLRVFTGPDTRIYSDLYFEKPNPFQLDTLLLTQGLILSIDSKNHDGETKIDSPSDFSHQNDSYGNERRLSNPIPQAKYHSFKLMDLFQKHGIYSVPIEALIVNTNPVGIMTSDITDIVVDVKKIPERIVELQKKYPKRILTSNDFNKIHKWMMDENKLYTIDVEQHFGLKKEKFINGVPCPKAKCGHLGMERKNGYWQCPIDGEKSVDAHARAIRDWFLLVKPTITVSECCALLGIESRFIAGRLLRAMNLPFTGTNRGRIYYAPWYRGHI